MLTAVLTDIHANREALDACLADARRRGAEQFAFLGDLVGYGADPAYVVDTVAEMRAQGAVVIKGNHDCAVTQTLEGMNSAARTAIEWTRTKLDATQKQFLANLPLMVSVGEVLFVHAEASHPAQWIYISRLLEAERSMLRDADADHNVRPHPSPAPFSYGATEAAGLLHSDDRCADPSGEEPSMACDRRLRRPAAR